MRWMVLFASLASALAQLTTINNAVGEFSIALLKATLQDEKNTIHSAYSIWSALGMCLVGSEDQTYANMEDHMFIEGMTLPDFEKSFKLSAKQLSLAKTSSRLGFAALSANRIYVNESFPLGQKYIETIATVFDAVAKSVNFKASSPAIRTEINSFVSNATKKLIPKLLHDPLEEDTLIALINALYFRGSWVNAMSSRPSSRLFNAGLDNAQPANWIGVMKTFNYGKSSKLEATLIELPYAQNPNSNDKAAFVIIFPDEQHKTDFRGWIAAKFNWQKISSAILSTSATQVNLTMPKFKVEASFELADTLTQLGMSVPFSDGANFDGMVDINDAKLKISKVIHKAKMTVDEKGTEAAAATASTMVKTSASVGDPLATAELKVDRSFVALIILRQENRKSIVPLFTTVINNLP